TIDANGHWNYILDNTNTAVQALNVGQTLTDTFTVTTSDGTPQQIPITINGTNDAAIISGTTTGAVTEAGGINNATTGTPSASGILTDMDVDNTPNTFTAVTAPANSTNVTAPTNSSNGYGSYTIDASGHWNYTLDN